MGEVISIIDRMEHLAGDAKCLACGHKWVAVVPAGVCDFECPECRTHRGVMMYGIMPETHYVCACGCAHFGIGEGWRAICVRCGKVAKQVGSSD